MSCNVPWRPPAVRRWRRSGHRRSRWTCRRTLRPTSSRRPISAWRSTAVSPRWTRWLTWRRREELTDRFGALPPELEALLDLTRLRLLCQARGIAAVHAGPAAVALTPRGPAANLPAGREANGRLLLPIEETSPAVRLWRILAALEGE